MIDFYKEFVGLDTKYALADDSKKRRIHLDGAASPLVMKTARDAQDALLPHYSNSHSHAHASAHICGDALRWARKTILSIAGANSEYTLVTLGNGSTAVLNNIARRLKQRSTDRPIVFVSAMEHHANDLPHRHQQHGDLANLVHIPLKGDAANQGEIDVSALRALFELHKDQVNYITFSGVSNVTGIVNPVEEITALAHEYGALAVLDAAQSAPHMNLKIAEYDIDFAAFSGHKIYCAGSPGILIAKQNLLHQYPSDEVGGGVINHVSYQDVEYIDTYPEREQAGTKNILGIYALAKVMQTMQTESFDTIQEHGESLWAYAYKQLQQIPSITIYGKTDAIRLGALAFNIKGLDHGLVAAVLSDYFAVAVRNECFCAHPYVSSLIKKELWELDLEHIPDDQQEQYINRKRGMVRASFSLYNTTSDIDALCEALTAIISNSDKYLSKYSVHNDGSYRHKTFKLNWENHLNT